MIQYPSAAEMARKLRESVFLSRNRDVQRALLRDARRLDEAAADSASPDARGDSAPPEATS